MLSVRDLWHGKLRLWITYRICGVGGNMSFFDAKASVGSDTGRSQDLRPSGSCRTQGVEQSGTREGRRLWR
jgi:hypothetical protein